MLYQMNLLKPNEKFELRKETFLRFIVANTHNPEKTIWGSYRLFDGYALAHLALEQNLSRAHQLIEETLTMVRVDVEREMSDPTMKWNLSDFALHPLLRAYFLYHTKFFNTPEDTLWLRVEQALQQHKYHFNDLTENHNLLHLALSYLVAQTWPEATFADGRPARAHQPEARVRILAWMDSWITRGSSEWGSEIYYNVNLLALLNLHDFAMDLNMRRIATGLLDLLVLDEAIDTFAGSFVGASRRSYGAYRLDTNESPSRNLHFLYFGTGGETLNLNYVGGVIEAATSSYRPPEAVISIATDRKNTFTTHTTHTVGLWADASHLSKTTLRTPDVMLSTMNSPGGPYRYTEHVWQATLGSKALVFANHPTLHSRAFSNHPGSPQDILSSYENAQPSTQHQYWTVGNVPPGYYGDTRPGFWQGNSWGPRSYSEGSLAFMIYDIPTIDPLPWIHLFFPRPAFEEVKEKDSWIFGRKGDGFVGVWLPEGYQWTKRGMWANVEIRSHKPRNAILVYVGRTATHGSFEGFVSSTTKLDPMWNAASLTLSARSMEDGALVHISYSKGPFRNGKPVPTRFARFETQWGSMPLGSRKLILKKDGHCHTTDMRAILAPTVSVLASYYRSQKVKQFLRRMRYIITAPLIRRMRPHRILRKIHRSSKIASSTR